MEELKRMLSYDPSTGVFTWIGNGRGIRRGNRAGSVDPLNGYRIIRFKRKDYLAQRLAWYFVHNQWPRLIRFQNGDRDDCRIDNLKEGFYVSTKFDHRTKEGRSAYQKEYRSSLRDVFSAKERERKFGIKPEEYQRLHDSQGGRCAICNSPESETRNGKVKMLAVDHCHETGKIRGLLCCPCNQAIGKMRDDPAIMRRAADYIDRHRKP